MQGDLLLLFVSRRFGVLQCSSWRVQAMIAGYQSLTEHAGNGRGRMVGIDLSSFLILIFNFFFFLMFACCCVSRIPLSLVYDVICLTCRSSMTPISLPA
jgi:hypothetical protein